MAPSIFHAGDLNSGISLAISQRKLVVVLVRAADDPESARWETSWLQGGPDADDKRSLGRALGARAVLLRIDAGSREAEFLAAFCPTAAVPALAVIRDGVVLERIERGVGEEDFVKRVAAAAGLDADGWGQGEEQMVEEGETAQPVEAVQEGETAVVQDTHSASAVETATSTPSSTSAASSAPVRQLLDERAARLAAERKQREEAERAAQTARAQARRKEAEEASAAHRDKGKGRAAPEKNEQQKAREAWLYQQKQRKDEAKKERERILARIEADKQERRARATMAKEAQTSGGDGGFSELSGVDRAPRAAAARQNSDKCSLQVRLFDGSSIRGTFAADADIASAVRTWIRDASAEGGADQPYTLRQILAPQPSRAIEISEEHQSLAELGLVPTATLVLVPVAQYTDAYSRAGGGYVGAALHAAYGVASSGYGLLGSVASYLPDFGGAASPATANSQQAGDGGEARTAEGARAPGPDPSSSSVRVKTLADQRADAARKQGNEFYNGNSLRFEGRDDKDSHDG